MRNRLGKQLAFVGLPGIVMLVMNNAVSAEVITPNPLLPPDTGVYRSATDVHAEFSGPDLLIVLQDPLHKPIADRDKVVRETIGSDERETFDSTFTGIAIVTSVAMGLNETPIPFSLEGPVVTDVFNKTSLTGSWDTEMVSMSLTGFVGGPSGLFVIIQESPSIPSLGHTTVTDLGGGSYQIDSFFDVFTEISLDGGTTFIPSSGNTRMEVMPEVPEPSTIANLFLLAVCGAGLRWYRKRRAA